MIYTNNCVNYTNKNSTNLALDLLKKAGKHTDFIIVCIGSLDSISDSLGARVGSMLKLFGIQNIIYGDLQHPITASNFNSFRKMIAKHHKSTKILAIDSALGNEYDIGNIKIYNCGLIPRSAIENNFPMIGDMSILGIVGDCNSTLTKNLHIYNRATIDNMALTICKAIKEYIKFCEILG